MGRGFLAGIFWGGVVGLGLLLVSSQTLGRQQLSFPKPEASPVELPGGSEFDQARAETDPVLPGTEKTPASDEILAGVQPPSDAVDAPPAFDTSSLDVPTPVVEGPENLADVPPVAEEVSPPELGSAVLGSQGNAAGEPASPSLEAPETPIAAPDTDTAAPQPIEMPKPEPQVVAGTSAPDQAPEVEIAALPSGGADAGPALANESAPSVVSEDQSPVSPVSPEISESPSMPGVRMPEPAAEPEQAGVQQPEAAAEPVLVQTDAGTAPDVAREPDAPSMAQTEEQESTAEAAPAPEVAREAAPAPEAMPAPEVAAAPETGGIITVDGGESKFFTPVEAFEDKAENVETGRLPTIGGDDEETLPVVRRLPGSPLTDEPVADSGDGAVTDNVDTQPPFREGPALRAFAMDFQVPRGTAMVSVVLLHEGLDAPDPSVLSALPATIAFAVDAGSPEASGIAAAYRAAGREVVMIPSLPEGAAPQDVEVALGVSLKRVPEAVALMDVTGSSFQSDREAVAQIVAVASDTGHGLVTFPRGLNTAHQQAERAGVPTGLIFRLLDDDGETDEQIQRALDRAAFRARQSDGVILVGHERAGTVAAVAAWAEAAGSDVTLAPISSVLGAGK